jgi:hypothetical protein
MKLALHLPVAVEVKRRNWVAQIVRLLTSVATWRRRKSVKGPPARRRTVAFLELP